MKAMLVFEMPKKCNECPCYNDEYFVCQMKWKKVDGFKEVVDWCPIKPVPNDVSKDDLDVYVKGYMDSLVGRVDDEGDTK